MYANNQDDDHKPKYPHVIAIAIAAGAALLLRRLLSPPSHATHTTSQTHGLQSMKTKLHGIKYKKRPRPDADSSTSSKQRSQPTAAAAAAAHATPAPPPPRHAAILPIGLRLRREQQLLRKAKREKEAGQQKLKQFKVCLCMWCVSMRGR